MERIQRLRNLDKECLKIFVLRSGSSGFGWCPEWQAANEKRKRDLRCLYLGICFGIVVLLMVIYLSFKNES